jgi:1,4-alpha-glucan branching enzyme
MIKKRKLANNKYSVTFSMPALDGISTLYLVGEFNDWALSGTPMEKAADDTWSIKLTLEGGKDYQYRYRDDKDNWHNDWAPDAYVHNQYGSENSMLSLANGDQEPSPKRAAAKKKKAL